MPHWMIKAAVQGVISRLPKGNALNYLFQKHVSGGVNLNKSVFESKLYRCRTHLESYRQLKPEINNPWVGFELGTGWHPVIPIGLYLCGALRVWTVDKVCLLYPKPVRETLEFFVRTADGGNLKKILPWVIEERISKINDTLKDFNQNNIGDTLNGINIYPIVCDARYTGLESGSVDFFVSNNTLEHIPGKIILDILEEFNRIALPGAIMSHYIDMRDHYCYFDSSITSFNYLKYSDRSWRWFNNSLHYQNRLRLSDYRRIHEESGFVIRRESHEKGSISDLKKENISKKFKRYSEADLRIVGGWIISSRSEVAC